MQETESASLFTTGTVSVGLGFVTLEVSLSPFVTGSFFNNFDICLWFFLHFFPLFYQHIIINLFYPFTIFSNLPSD